MPSLGFGLERIGLPALRHPFVALLLVALFSAFCAVGVPRLKTDHTLSELFRSNTEAFRNYETLSRRFPTSEFDVLIVIEGPNLLTPEALETIRNAHLELQFAEALDGVLSIFSMREPPDEKGYPPPLIPAELPQGAQFDRLAERVMSHPLIGGKLLSYPDQGSQLTLLIATLKRDVLRRDGMFPLIREVERIARDAVEPSGLRVQLAGAPVMQLEIREAIQRDRLIYNSAGFLVGFLVNLVFFRRLKLVLITSICPAIAVLWALGLLGWMGLELNTFINVIPPLVMVIAFTDAMHMVFSIRRNLAEGRSRFEAARHAVLTVGPACVLTSITTAIAFLSLTLTDSALIRSFGLAAALATLFAFVVVIAIVPTLVVLLFRDEQAFIRTEAKRHRAVAWLERLCTGLAGWIPTRYLALSIAGLVIAGLFSAMHLQLEPHYRLSDQVPDTKQSVAASERLDTLLTGAYPVHVMIDWPEGMTVTSPRVIEAIADTHRLLEAGSGVGNVWGVETLRRWLADIGQARPEVLADYIEQLPDHVVDRFINRGARSSLVTGRLPNLDAHDSVEVLNRLDRSLAGLRTRFPDFTFTVTGLTAVTALQSADMIGQLNRGLLAAVVVVIALMGFAFRSVRIAAVSVVPNLVPIVAAGAFIYLTGGGLEYASVIALTVAFGIAVDDTIHFLNRLRVEEGRARDPEAAVYETVAKIGPVLILTTLVLVVGLAVTLISELPAMRLFGQLFVTTLAAALATDLLVLPALIIAINRLRSATAALRTR